jgi:hypothetical protein
MGVAASENGKRPWPVCRGARRGTSSVPRIMRRALATSCILIALAACRSGVDEGNLTCPGQVTVTRGLLAGGSAGQAVAASTFSPSGPRILLAGTETAGCSLETNLGLLGGSGEASTIRLTLAGGTGPGKYQISQDAGAAAAAFAAQYSFSSPYYGGFIGAAQSASLTLTLVDPAQGIQGFYHLDFGGADVSGGTSGNGGSGVGSLGELVEEGAFIAPVCDLCSAEPRCGDAGCASGQVCLRGCGGPDGECVAAPSCSGAPSCQNCDTVAGLCASASGEDCASFDGLSLVCGCFP